MVAGAWCRHDCSMDEFVEGGEIVSGDPLTSLDPSLNRKIDSLVSTILVHLTRMNRMLAGLLSSGIWRAGLAGAALLVSIAACEITVPSDRSATPRAAEDSAPYQAEVDEGLGAAVAILIDTSGSMREQAPGDTRSKHVIAHEALQAMLDATDAFVAKRPDL